ncbi:MAG: internal scaffolding protein [Arizlama microvirus]|nr:MAG: internal scaffolding protein [Arizlama microvirus]
MRFIQDMSKSPNIVQQRFKTDVNINHIVEKAKVQGRLPENRNKGFFGDFSSIDFNAMQNTVAQAREGFNLLPSKLRARFGNDPTQLINFVNDDENYEEAIKLGLVPPRPEAVVPAPLLDVTGTTDTKPSAGV